MHSDFLGPVNIGSEEMVTINQLAQMAIDISGKPITIQNIYGERFREKYGFKCPVGVRGRNSDNRLYREKVGWEVTQPLYAGMKITYNWIVNQVSISWSAFYVWCLAHEANSGETNWSCWLGTNVLWIANRSSASIHSDGIVFIKIISIGDIMLNISMTSIN